MYNQNMKKYIIVGSIGFFVLLVAGGFGWAIFSKKKTVDVKSENSISSMQQETESEQKTENNEQGTMISEQQEENIISEKKENEQKPANTNDKKTAAENGSPDDSKETTKDPESVSKIIDKFISWGFEKASDRKIDTIIIHSSYDALGKDPYSVDGIIAEYKQYGVSAHYLIARDGKIYHLVADKNIAYHAGVSKVPDGRTGVNEFSIGIEMINTEDGKYTNAQYSALNSLIGTLKKQNSIKYILGHKDIAPGRKTDPWGLQWDRVNK